MSSNPYRIIPLTKGYVAIISAKHYRRVNKYSWHVHYSRGTKKKQGQPYARATIGGKKVYLHRFITGAYAPLHVDHKNWQTLDCRDENLLVCTHQENMENRRYIINSKKKKNPVDIIVCNTDTQTIETASAESFKTEENQTPCPTIQ